MVPIEARDPEEGSMPPGILLLADPAANDPWMRRSESGRMQEKCKKNGQAPPGRSQHGLAECPLSVSLSYPTPGSGDPPAKTRHR